MKKKAIRVVIADDHPVYREAIARLIRQRPELELVAECRNGDEALAAIERESPDVALLDVRMPGRNGIDVLKQLRESGHDGTRVVMLSAISDGATVYDAIAAGASGYLLKDAERADICDALLAASSGRAVFSPDVHAGLADEIRHKGDARHSLLSPRETQVLELTAAGMSAREIATQLIIGEATVKSHLHHSYEKLAVTDRAAAVAEAMRRGILN